MYISFASGSQREPHLQWNIGGVGSSGVGHVYFMYISCCLCIIFRKIPVEYGLKNTGVVVGNAYLVQASIFFQKSSTSARRALEQTYCRK